MGDFSRKIDKFIDILINQDGYLKVLEGLQNTLLIAVLGLIIGILIGTVIAIVRVLQFVGHHAESHDLLPDERVGPCDVHVHLRVVDLVGQPVIHDLRQVPAGHRERNQLG